MRLRDARRFTRPLTVVAGSLLAIAAGFACLNYSFAEALTRASYDLPFVWRANLDTHEIVLVYLDEESAKKLNQPIDDKWNRALHVALLERLTRDGARLVFYDIVFDTPSLDPAKDEAFAEALQGFGKAILGGDARDRATDGWSETGASGAADQAAPKSSCGLGHRSPSSRWMQTTACGNCFPDSDIPSATWKAAEILGAEATREPRESTGATLDQLLRTKEHLLVR